MASDLIDIKAVFKFSMFNEPINTGTSADNGHGQFLIGYMTAIAVKIGYSADHLKELRDKWRTEAGSHRIGSLELAMRMHKWLEAEIAKLD